MSKFSETLKRIRKQRKMSQVELASKIGVSRSTISMYEMGEREPDFETLEALADVFNVDMAYLIGTETKKAPAKAEANDDVIIRFIRSLPRERLRGILLALGAPEEVLSALDQKEPTE